MAPCVEHGFDILLTIDKNLQYQQNLHLFSIAIVILHSLSSKLEEVADFLPVFKLKLNSFERHKAYLLDK